MQFLEYENILLFSGKICFWKRYVADIFLFAKQEDLTEILEEANFIRPPAQFTIENEIFILKYFVWKMRKSYRSRNFNNSIPQSNIFCSVFTF